MSVLNVLSKFNPISFFAVAIGIYWFYLPTNTNSPYLLSNTIRDLKDENRGYSTADISLTDLSDINVIYERVNMDNWGKHIDNFSIEHGMTRRDMITISRETLGSQFDSKMFSTEHLHEDAEVRFIKEGSGYFDFRSKKDEWIRMHVTPGDLIFLPAGIYHRFTTDHSDYTVAVRLFQDSPQWKAVYRSSDSEELPIRKKYLQEIGL